MTEIRNSMAIILIAIFLTTVTCTTDNSITGNTGQYLGKTAGVVADSSKTSNDDCVASDDPFGELGFGSAFGTDYNFRNRPIVVLMNSLLDEGLLDELPTDGWNYGANITKPSYSFRDNYLSKTVKGKKYTKYYYELSKYGIKNNLVNKYPKEHLGLLIISIDIVQNLQHGSNNNRILINEQISDALKDMLKVYRNSPNHEEIEPVLEYLEADLEKYRNKPKHEIALDFE
jgi:hypothetical protein